MEIDSAGTAGWHVGKPPDRRATAEAAIERLCDPRSEVSAHYLIDRSGAVTRMVENNVGAILVTDGRAAS